MATTDPSSGPTPPKRLQGRNANHTAWLMRRIWDRLNVKNEHFMGVIVGQEGSGKSYTALKIANAVDPTFSADRVIFDVAELLEVLRDGEHEPGQFWVLDEAGVQFGIRTWQDRGQILANQALQLIRNENLGLIFTLPRLSELDSQAQGRLQAFVEMVDKVNSDGEQYVECKWKWMDPDRADDTGKIYKKYPRRRQHGKLKRITRLRFGPPSEEITEPYEAEKAEFQEEFYEETIQELSDEDADEEEKKTPHDVAEELKDDIEKVVDQNNRTGRTYVNDDLVRATCDVSVRDAKTVKSLLEREFDEEELKQYV
jgi:hypothetical protein